MNPCGDCGILLGLVSCAILSVLWRYFRASRRATDFPPGPRKVPFLGNLHQLPRSKAFLKFHEWSQTYGSIVGLKLGPQNVVVLNSWKHARELFDKRGAIYSGRRDNHVSNDLICSNQTHILLVPYGPGWRVLRKTVQALLNVKAVDAMFPTQNAEATQTMCRLLQDPEGYYDHIRRYSTVVILSSVFGQRGPEFNSPKVRALYHAQEQFTSILEPGATPPVEATEAVQSEQRSLYFALLEETKARIGNGDTTGCLMERILKDQEKTGLDDDHVAYLGGILMEAASDTTASTLLSYMLGMISNPAAFAKEELDSLCGTERSPNFDDLDSLPYLKACMTETLRWRPVAPGGIPHLLMEDDTYQGYHLPKGTIVFTNAWSIHREQGEYDAGDAFCPDRFLDNKFGALESQEADDHRRDTYSFGAGRRMLNMAKITWGFEISAQNAEIELDIETTYTDGFVFSPKRLPVKIAVRSQSGAELQAQQNIFAKYED
ncbi:cytochrome P450 [Aspergillus crustosus]